MTTRKPCRWANYPGDVRGNLGRVVGPNTVGAFFHIVSEEYDAATDRTRVGFGYGLPAAT